ncbi:MAG: putative exporter [Planctomycetota bacterium]
MIRGEGRALGAGVLVLVALTIFVALRLELTTDITHFLPGGESDPEVSIAKELAAGELSRTMVLLVDGPDSQSAVEAGRAFEAALRAEPRVAEAMAHLEAGPPQGVEEALWKLYQPRRLGFFAPDADSVDALTTPAALRESAAYLKSRLALPISGLISRVAPEDPTLILPGLFDRLQGGSGSSLSVLDGRFITDDGRAAVLFLGTHAPSTDSRVQKPLLEGVAAAFAQVEAESALPIFLSISGANRFAVRAERAIKADIQRVSIGSLLGLLLLLLSLFHSLRLVVLVLPIVASGFVAGLAACLLLFGSVHGLTLAFGAAMTGVSIDYAIHFHCHQALAPHPGGPRKTLASIWKGLSLGAATTIMGFVAILLSKVPGLRELAVFSTVGIACSLLATQAFLPALALRSKPPASTRRAVAGLTRLLTGGSRAMLWLPTAAVIFLIGFGLPKLSWNDGLSDLNRLDPELVAEDEAVRERVVRYEQGRLVVAVGVDEEAALQVNEAVAAALDSAQAAGEIEGSRSLNPMLPSAATQRAVDARLRADADLWPRLSTALEGEGFVPDSFEPFHAALQEPAPTPLRLADLQASPLAPMVRPFRVTLGERVGIVSFLHQISDEPALRSRLEAIEGASLIDIEGTLSGAYGAYRQRMLRLTLLGLVAIVGLVALRHGVPKHGVLKHGAPRRGAPRRGALRPTLTACAPAFLAAAGTVAILSLLGLQLNVLSLVALLMVVSMGVDYGVFLTESSADAAALEATHLAVFVAGTSTLLGFGLLAFSSQPPLFSIGITAGIGVLLCFLLAPTWNALLGPKHEAD